MILRYNAREEEGRGVVSEEGEPLRAYAYLQEGGVAGAGPCLLLPARTPGDQLVGTYSTHTLTHVCEATRLRTGAPRNTEESRRAI